MCNEQLLSTGSCTNYSNKHGRVAVYAMETIEVVPDSQLTNECSVSEFLECSLSNTLDWVRLQTSWFLVYQINIK